MQNLNPLKNFQKNQRKSYNQTAKTFITDIQSFRLKSFLGETFSKYPHKILRLFTPQLNCWEKISCAPFSTFWNLEAKRDQNRLKRKYICFSCVSD
jgi:hypothetical protein